MKFTVLVMLRYNGNNIYMLGVALQHVFYCSETVILVYLSLRNVQVFINTFQLQGTYGTRRNELLY